MLMFGVMRRRRARSRRAGRAGRSGCRSGLMNPRLLLKLRLCVAEFGLWDD